MRGDITIRQFLMNNFNDSELEDLCLDYFPEVKNEFTNGMEKGQKVRLLIGYCQRRGLTSNLLAALERERPKLYTLSFTSEPVVSESTTAYHSYISTNIEIDEKTGLVMVQIPSGEFWYGKKKKKRYLQEFWISKTPVTNACYSYFVQERGYEPPKHWKGEKVPPQEIASHPVVYVSWYDAQEYTRWANKRLPTEGEWEKAARGMDVREYPWGNQLPTSELCNFGMNVGTTTSVGRYSPQGDSPYGCVDMSGNVWEWTDSYNKSQTGRVVRGGSWGYDQEFMSVAFRDYYVPDASYDNIGFRLAFSVVSAS